MLFEKPDLHQPVHAVANRPQLVFVRPGEAMAQRHVAVRSHAHQPQPGPARVCFAGALVDLFQRVLHVREPVVPPVHRRLQPFAGQRAELAQHGIESLVVDGVLALRRGGYRRKAHLPEPDILGQMPVDFLDVQGLGRQRDARADGAGTVLLQEFPDLGFHDIVAARSVLEHAEPILHFLGPVDRDGDAHPVLHQPFDHVLPQQGGIRRQAEVHFLAQFDGPLARIRHGDFQHRQVHQSLAAEERAVYGLVRAALLEHEVHALAGGLGAHELRLCAVLGVDDFVFAVLVAIGAAQVALVGDIQHHGGEREVRRDLLPRDRLPYLARFADRAHIH